MKSEQTSTETRPRRAVCPICGSGVAKIERKSPDYSYLSCGECGAHYVETDESKSSPQELFDNYGWTQEYIRQYDAYLPRIQHSLKEKLRACEALMGRRPQSMLDVGCGNGLYSHAAMLMGLKVVATEVDASSAAVAKEHGVDVRIGKLEDLSITGSFDFVHIKAVLHLCPQPVVLLRSAVEKISKDGILYVDASHQDGIASKIRRTFSRDPLRYGQLIPPKHCISYTRQSFQTLLARVGLSPDRIFTYSSHDPVYYPVLSSSLKGSIEHFIKAGYDSAGMGAFLGAYCRAPAKKA